MLLSEVRGRGLFIRIKSSPDKESQKVSPSRHPAIASKTNIKNNGVKGRINLLGTDTSFIKEKHKRQVSPGSSSNWSHQTKIPVES